MGLYATASRARTDVRRRDRLDEASIGLYSELGVHATERIRVTVGLRGDYYDWEVAALDRWDQAAGNDSLAGPKVSVAYRILDGLEAYANWGRGFHSNDVRLRGEAGLLAASEGAELGLRFEPHPSFNATLVGFRLGLDSELVYVGDAGATEPSGASVRRGVEIAGFWKARDWLTLNAAYTDSGAELDNGDEIVGAVGVTGPLGRERSRGLRTPRQHERALSRRGTFERRRQPTYRRILACPCGPRLALPAYRSRDRPLQRSRLRRRRHRLLLPLPTRGRACRRRPRHPLPSSGATDSAPPGSRPPVTARVTRDLIGTADRPAEAARATGRALFDRRQQLRRGDQLAHAVRLGLVEDVALLRPSVQRVDVELCAAWPYVPRHAGCRAVGLVV